MNVTMEDQGGFVWHFAEFPATPSGMVAITTSSGGFTVETLIELVLSFVASPYVDLRVIASAQMVELDQQTLRPYQAEIEATLSGPEPLSWKNRRLLAVLEKLSARPDELGEDWWDEFDKLLRENRFRVRKS